MNTPKFSFATPDSESAVLLGAVGGAIKGAVVGVVTGKLVLGLTLGACGGALFGYVATQVLRRHSAQTATP